MTGAGAPDSEVRMDGFINLLKPPGMTSSDAVVYVRKRLPRGTKVGHAGTLDPEAAGVLPVMVGRAARLSDYIMDGEKEYVCEIALGVATDTQDAQGAQVGARCAPASGAELRAALPAFTGRIMQTPSAFSALKVGGRKMCDILRAGGEVAPQPRPVTIHELEYLGMSAPDGHMLRIRCSKGTYIRALCDDIGRALGCGAHMRFLLRTLSAGFALDAAHTLEELDADLAGCLTPLDLPIAHIPAVLAGADMYARVRCGNRLPLSALRGDLGEGVRRLYVRRDAQPPCDVGSAIPEGYGFAGIVERDGEEMRFRAMLLEAED